MIKIYKILCIHKTFIIGDEKDRVREGEFILFMLFLCSCNGRVNSEILISLMAADACFVIYENTNILMFRKCYQI